MKKFLIILLVVMFAGGCGVEPDLPEPPPAEYAK